MSKGQALNEYLLIGGIVVLASVLTVGLLGQQLSGMFSGMIQANAPTAAPALVADFGLPAGPGTQTLSFPMQTANGPVEVHIPNYPADLAQTVETAGASGSSEMLASVLTQMADFLDNLDPPQTEDAALLRELSAHGFSLASLQMDLENKINHNIAFSSLDSLLLVNWGNSSQQNKINELQNPFVKALVEDAFGKMKVSGTHTAQYILDELSRRNRLQSFGIEHTSSVEHLKNSIINAARVDTELNASNICHASAVNRVEGLSCQPSG
jgi:hypothetical protein